MQLKLRNHGCYQRLFRIGRPTQQKFMDSGREAKIYEDKLIGGTYLIYRLKIY